MSILTLAGRRVEKDQRTAAILSCLSPHFAESLKGLHNSSFIKQRAMKHLKVTKREVEILKWLEQGKSTWDVSIILNRSERVIKYHVTNLMEKLSAQNRTHAVAIAIRQGLID
jgi:DNA-binding CsgD family transcriptional regulator